MTARTLPVPEVKDGTDIILFMAQLISKGEHKGAAYEVDGIAFNFSATVTFLDGSSRREVLDIQNIINDWLTQMIAEGPNDRKKS